ncbi:hypothetical protein FRC07_008994 [Ceratobasidium sp. 392]|nr:hypothetical protein FRC07_008994 [Ceratobasidium sp. 392]
MTQTALQPVNPSTIVEAEKENEAPWVVRKLVGGGTAAIAAPVMGPIADTAVSSFGDTIAVEIGTIVTYDVGTKLANDLIADKTVKAIIPVYSARLETTSVKTILITLKYKHTVSDAALGFFRSGTVHADGDLFSDVKDYLSVEKPPSAQPSPALSTSTLPSVAPAPRRILVVVLGLSPHRKLWTTSARPGESVLKYHLLNGCPALVLPATSANGSTPLVAWDTLTLEHMHMIGKEQGGIDSEAFKGIVTCLFEYLSLCVDWDRIIIPDEVKEQANDAATEDNDFRKKLVRDGLELVLAGAVRSHDSKAVKADMDTDRAGALDLKSFARSGEPSHLSRAERIAVIKTHRAAMGAAGAEGMPLIAGTGVSSTWETIEITKEAAEAGASYAMVISPGYFKSSMSDESLEKFFTEVADASPIPILVYNFPGVGAANGIDLDVKLIAKLAKHPKIVGIKLSCGNMGKAARLAALYSQDEFAIYMGLAETILHGLAGSGISGAITGLANIAPSACVRVFELYQKGDLEQAREAQKAVTLAGDIELKGGIHGMRYACEHYFGYGGESRRPFTPITEDLKEKTVTWLDPLIAKEK